MEPRVAATIGVRLVGLLVLVLAIPALAETLHGLVGYLVWYNWNLFAAMRNVLGDIVAGLTRVLMEAGTLVQAALGLWLLLRGQRVVGLLLRGLEGTCHKCGYDITGTTSPICPECGAKLGRTAGPRE